MRDDAANDAVIPDGIDCWITQRARPSLVVEVQTALSEVGALEDEDNVKVSVVTLAA